MKEKINTKVVPITSERIIEPLKIDIIESDKTREDSDMSQGTYSKSEIDLKLEKISTDVQHSFEKVDLKFEQINQKIDFSVNHILSETKNMLLEQQVKEKAERENERKSTNRWLIGIAISLAGLIISIIVNFFLGK